MTHQTTFAHAEFAAKKKTTRREKSLARMEEVIPWAQLLTRLRLRPTRHVALDA
jgi:IS5 family transposase